MERIARNPDQIGTAIRAERRRRGHTQAALAAATRLRQATISAVEAGEAGTRLDTLLDLMAALDLELVIRPRTRGPDIEATL